MRKGADPVILETLMEDIEVLDHRQIVSKSDQENPVKAVSSTRVCSSASTDEIGEQSKASSSGKRHGTKTKCSA